MTVCTLLSLNPVDRSTKFFLVDCFMSCPVELSIADISSFLFFFFSKELEATGKVIHTLLPVLYDKELRLKPKSVYSSVEVSNSFRDLRISPSEFSYRDQQEKQQQQSFSRSQEQGISNQVSSEITSEITSLIPVASMIIVSRKRTSSVKIDDKQVNFSLLAKTSFLQKSSKMLTGNNSVKIAILGSKSVGKTGKVF